MANISDTIEQFILSVIGDDDTLQLSRNELANYFAVAPSQINYVLATRFNLDRGYIIESKRGGGGSITLVRIHDAHNELLKQLVEQIDKVDVLSYQRTCNVIDRLVRDEIVTEDEGDIMKSALSDKALNVPMDNTKLRKNVFQQILIGLMKR